MTKVYNAVGLVSKIIIINMNLSTRTITARTTTLAQVDPIEHAQANPVTIGACGSFSYLQEIPCTEMLLKWTTNPVLKSNEHKRDWICVHRYGACCTKSFATKMSLAYWAVDTYGNNWPLHLQSNPSTPP